MGQSFAVFLHDASAPTKLHSYSCSDDLRPCHGCSG
jgi:hypothetical protein